MGCSRIKATMVYIVMSEDLMRDEMSFNDLGLPFSLFLKDLSGLKLRIDVDETMIR